LGSRAETIGKPGAVVQCAHAAAGRVLHAFRVVRGDDAKVRSAKDEDPGKPGVNLRGEKSRYDKRLNDKPLQNGWQVSLPEV